MRKSSGITLENLGLTPSVDPMVLLHEDNEFEFPGYFKKPARTSIEVYGRHNGGYRVVIATEIDSNPGVSITNGSESLARTICEELHIKPQDLVLIEHYEKDSILDEHYDLVKFTFRRDREGLHFENREWFPLDAEQLDRLIGEGVAVR